MIKIILFAALLINLSASAQTKEDTARHYKVIRTRMGSNGIHLVTTGVNRAVYKGDSLHQGKILFVDVKAECTGKMMYGETMLSEKEGDIWHQQAAHDWIAGGVFAGSGYKLTAKDGRLLVTVTGGPGVINWTIVIKDK